MVAWHRLWQNRLIMNVISRFLFSLLIAVLSGFGCGPAADQEPFTIVMLPDTQFYAETYPKSVLSGESYANGR